jgi:hypothetical protein
METTQALRTDLGETRPSWTPTHTPGGILSMRVLIPQLRELAYFLFFACDLWLFLMASLHRFP